MYLKPEFASLLQGNDAPSVSTILEVTESLKAPLNELQEVEAEIQRLEKLMETMKTKQQNIQTTITSFSLPLADFHQTCCTRSSFTASQPITIQL